jgi:hypothetical protein
MDLLSFTKTKYYVVNLKLLHLRRPRENRLRVERIKLVQTLEWQESFSSNSFCFGSDFSADGEVPQLDGLVVAARHDVEVVELQAGDAVRVRSEVNREKAFVVERAKLLKFL